MAPHNDDERSIFPALLNGFEKALLHRLSTESGVSKSEIIRRLLLREMAQRELVRRESK